ncbi:two-component system sensor histidine kinase NtrB [Dethiosulfatarculus sandiegensis]|uniref:histidine kinase n=1 Tax=Dethiosulfatarculus sandiegensis TaxID=1429043 RepID=A0A0D2JUQ3_9BACT|nr:ATP-binding protein [Dethiosulfatarculus sandiegensis]KIX13265.1 hypothetical protein X474_14800 [Dethiosulfatarculus sandiegensis]
MGSGYSKQPKLTSDLIIHKEVMLNIIQSIADGVMVINRTGDIILVNQALCRILEMDQDRILGKGWGELFIADEANLDFAQVVVDVIQKNQVHYNREVCYASPSAKTKELIANTSLLREDDGDIIGVVAVFKDVTELKGLHRREVELLRQSRMLYDENKEGLDRIARAVAHEVRNPVTAIGGLAHRLLKEESPNSRGAAYLKRIVDGAKSLERIVEQVRLYSEIPRPSITEVQLDKWLKEFLSDYRGRAEQQAVRITLNLDQHIKVRLDHTLMHMALGHIVENALDSMPAGGEFTVDLKAETGWAVVDFSDTGRGMEKSEIPYLFDPFYTTKADSVGMSLAISRRILAEHFAEIKAKSTPGKGSEFTVRLPLAPDQA